MSYTKPETQRKYRQAHPDLFRESREKYRGIKRSYVYNYLLTHPCVDCGEMDIVVLEFDHVYGEKNNGISDLVGGTASLETLQNEMEKCVVRCANCHRRRHF